MMEKHGVIEPGRTPQIKGSNVKQAATQTPKQQTESLDDDFTKRAADKAAGGLKSGK